MKIFQLHTCDIILTARKKSTKYLYSENFIDYISLFDIRPGVY